SIDGSPLGPEISAATSCRFIVAPLVEPGTMSQRGSKPTCPGDRPRRRTRYDEARDVLQVEHVRLQPARHEVARPAVSPTRVVPAGADLLFGVVRVPVAVAVAVRLVADQRLTGRDNFE